MQAVVGHREAKRRESAIAAAKQEKSSGLSMYVQPPSEDISIEDFEAFALDRLAVLKGAEDALARGTRGDKLEELMNELLARYNLQLVDPTSTKAVPEAAHKDFFSHFILRLAYCRTEELRRWYLTQECALFRHRFNQLGSSQRAQFLLENNLRYEQVNASDWDELSEALYAAAASQLGSLHSLGSAEVAKSQTQHGAAGFYKVPFEDVPELVRTRKVLVRGGSAFVPAEQLSVLVTGAFRAGLSKALTLTARRWATTTSIEEAERLTPVVEALSTQYLGSDFSSAPGGAGGLSLAQLGSAMEQSAPLCMRNLFLHLKDDHHLRHNGRMQLGLFLKGAGLSLEDALLFWRTEFCKKITPEQFEKQYSYNVRHNYGKEGKRQDYTPYSCMKVCSATPGAGEHHGCPYRTFNEESLRAALRGLKISSGAVEGIVEKAKNKHYQLACGDTFAARFGKELAEGVQHPNQYFRESRRALGLDTQAEDAAAADATPAGGSAVGTGATAVAAN